MSLSDTLAQLTKESIFNATIVLGMIFGAEPGPSDVEIMGDMIEDQTKAISGMIDAQTDILLAASQAAADQIDEQTLELTNEIRAVTKELRIEFFYQMIDDMEGIYSALKMKRLHLEHYAEALAHEVIENIFSETCLSLKRH